MERELSMEYIHLRKDWQYGHGYRSLCGEHGLSVQAIYKSPEAYERHRDCRYCSPMPPLCGTCREIWENDNKKYIDIEENTSYTDSKIQAPNAL